MNLSALNLSFSNKNHRKINTTDILIKKYVNILLIINLSLILVKMLNHGFKF